MHWRVAVRSVKTNPRYSWMVIITLGLGIGVSTATFSIAESLLLAPLPYESPDQLVVVARDFTDVGGSRNGSLSRRTFAAVQKVSALELVEAQFSYLANIGEQSLDQVVTASRVTPGFLTELGVAPLLGRTLGPGDRNVVVLSYRLWQGAFAGRSDIIGHSVRFEDVNPLREVTAAPPAPRFTVVGVMPREFWAPADFGRVDLESDLWIPLHPRDAIPNERTSVLEVFGRLAPGATMEQLRGELDLITSSFRDIDRDWRNQALWAAPMRDNHFRASREALLLLAATGLALLLLVLSNASSLVLARGVRRTSEFSVRSALGASRWHLVRMSLGENAVLVAVAIGLGVMLAHGLVALFAGYAPATTPRMGALGINGAALGITALVSAGSLALLTVVLLTARGDRDVFGGIRQARGGGVAGRIHFTSVTVQTALTVVLLVAVGLTVQGLRNMQQVDPVIEVDGRLTFSLFLPQTRFPDAVDKIRVMTAVHDAVSRIPGVRASGSADRVPPVQGGGSGLFMSDAGSEAIDVGVRTVTRGYLESLGLAVVAGRSFTISDDLTSDPVALASEATVRALWPGVSPLGRRLQSSDGDIRVRVVGVVPDLPHLRVGARPRAEIYILHEQRPWGQHGAIAHVEGDPLAYVEPIRAAIRSVDPDLPVSNVRRHDELYDIAMATPQFLSGALSLVTAAALFLAAVGTFAVLSQTVSSRRHEIAIRIALGATRLRLARVIAGDSVRMVTIGAVSGAVVALLVGPHVVRQAYGVGGINLPLLTGVVVLVIGVTLGATVPVLARAGQTEPSSLLRRE